MDPRGSFGAAVGEPRPLAVFGLIALVVFVVLGVPRVHAAPGSGEAQDRGPQPTGRASDTGQASSSSQRGPSAVESLAIPTEIDPDRMALIWRQASVAWPVRPLAPGGAPTKLALGLGDHEELLAGIERAPSVRGAVEIDGQRAVAVWIAALETVRVRQVGDAVPLRFIRGVDGNAAVVEPGREVAPGPAGERRFELFQPPSLGAVWSIEADAATRVIIERVAPRPLRYAAVEVEQALLDWIHAREPVEAMPSLLVPADDLARRLHLHAALAAELERIGGDDEDLRRGIEAWRMLAAINQIDRKRPPVRPYYVRDRPRKRPITIDESESVRLATEDSREYQGLDGPQRWTITRKGPGQLRIAARAWAPGDTQLVPAELRIYANGRYIQRLALSDRQAKHSIDPDTAIPKLEVLETEAGEAVGEFAETTIVLSPAKVDYEFELVGGPALLAIEGAKRLEASLLALTRRTPRKRAKAIARAVAKTDSDAGAWLELLATRELHARLPMTTGDPRLEALEQRSPILALELLALAATDERVDDRALERLLGRARPLLASLARDPGVDPAVRGELRTRWLELAAIKGQPGDFDMLIERVADGADPIVELPVEGLRLLAEQFAATREIIRSPVLAVLELARARAPADEGLREQTLRVWTALSRWSRRRPVSEQAFEYGLPFRPIGEWLVPRKTLPQDPAQLTNTWLRLEVGKTTRVAAKLGPGPLRRSLDGEDRPTEAGSGQAEAAGPEPGKRMRLVDIHVATPLDDPEPVLLQVDKRRWWSPQLAGVVRHRVAMAAGIHELTIQGPAETVAWAELPPADDVELEPELLGRRERMWSLADADWHLPGPAIPGVVRLELRWPLDQEPEPIRIVMVEHGEYEPGEAPPAKTIYFDPRKARVAAMSADEAALAIEPVEVDREATPMAGSPWASPRHEINLPIHAGTERLRFDVEGGLVVPAGLSLRRGLRPGDRFEGMSEARVVPEDELDPRVAAAFEGLASLSGEALLDEIGGLSRLLLYTPSDLDSRARRAAVLLMLGETGHARADLVRLSAWADNDEVSRSQGELAKALLVELEERFDRLIEPREILVTQAGGGREAELIEPALAAVVGPDRVVVEPWLETWMRTRRASDDEALAEIDRTLAELAKGGPDGPGDLERVLDLGDISRAAILSRDRLRAREASRAWIELYAALRGQPGRAREPIAVGLAAVSPLLEHLDDPDSDGRDAGLAYGLARELEPAYGHTSVRRLAFIAALRSAWETLDHSTDNAGFERLELPVSALQRSPSARIREALLVAPWTASEAEELRPGRKGVLAWDAEPGAVESAFWCRVARPDLGPERSARADDAGAFGEAKLRMRLRAGDEIVAERDVEVGDAERVLVELPLDRRERHRLEVVLDADPIWLCSWQARILDEDEVGETASSGPESTIAERGESLDARRRARWWTADSDRGVEFVILGPASLDLEVRGVTAPLDDQPEALRVSIQPLRVDEQGRVRSGELEAAELALDAEPDKSVITEARRHFRVNHSTIHTVLLPEAIAYRVRLRSDRGRSVLRARVRRDRGEVPPPAQVSLRELDPRSQGFSDGFDWRIAGPGQVVIARDPIKPIANRIGSLDARVSVGLDEIGEVEGLLPRFGSEVRVGWRRELVEDSIYLMIAAQTRSRVGSPTVGGGLIGFGARVQPIGARLGASVDALVGPYGGRAAGSVRLYAWVDRPTWLGRFVQLRPGFTAGVRWQSLNPVTAVGPANSEPHPRVYLRYIEDHPLYLRPELELRAYPLQDMVLSTMLSLVPNSDLSSTDHVNVDLGFQGIGRRPRPWLPLWGASYQLSARFQDLHRDQTQLRHRISTELGLAVWARDVARISFGANYRLYLTPVLGPRQRLRNVVNLWIRLDAVFGRRLRDYGPGELFFAEPWAPLGWADDPHQARSTGLQYGAR